MTSKTSYFEPALFLRGLKKTFPVWFGYLVLWLLFLPLNILNEFQRGPSITDIYGMICPCTVASVVTTAVLALALAWALFHFLFRTTTAYDIAALPVRRESLFLTNFLCGLGIAFAAHLLIALVTFAATAIVGIPAFGVCMQFLAGSMLSFLGFFGFAVLIAIIVGNAVAMPLIYIVLNFAAFAVIMIVTELLTRFVYGLGEVSDSVLYIAMILSPLTLVFGGNVQVVYGWNESYTQRVGVTIGGFSYLYIIAAMGLISAVVAFFLLRKREMERSGDVVAIRALRPVFLYLFSVGCALVIGYVLAMLSSNSQYNFPIMLLLQLVGAFLGYFAAQMMLQKSVRVFTGKRTWIGFAALCFVLAATFSVARFDLFGYSKKVPDARSVKVVSFDHTRVSDKADIEAVVALHQQVVAQQHAQLSLLQNEPYNSSYLEFDYVLNDGSTLHRRFEVSNASDLPQQADTLLNSRSFLIARNAIPGDVQPGDISGGVIYGNNKNGDWTNYTLSSQAAYALYTTCILPDLTESAIGLVHYSTSSEVSSEIIWTDITIEINMSDTWHPRYYPADTGGAYSLSYDYSLTTDASRCIDYVEELGFAVPQ